MRLDETTSSHTVDCEDEICADAPIEIPIAVTFSSYDQNWPWADNIGLIVLSKESDVFQ